METPTSSPAPSNPPPQRGQLPALSPELTRLLKPIGGALVVGALLGYCAGARDAARPAPALSSVPTPTLAPVALTAPSDLVVFDEPVMGYWAPDGATTAVVPAGTYRALYRWGEQYVQLDNQIWLPARPPAFRDAEALNALLAALPAHPEAR
jgi:hypothetical protein